MDEDNELAARWALAAIKTVRWLRAADPQPALTGAQASALAVVVHAGEITPSALAALEEVSRPTMARTLAQLEARGAIRRGASAADGRSLLIQATAAGRRLIARGHARRSAPLAAALASLSPAQRARLQAALPVIESLLPGAKP